MGSVRMSKLLLLVLVLAMLLTACTSKIVQENPVCHGSNDASFVVRYYGADGMVQREQHFVPSAGWQGEITFGDYKYRAAIEPMSCQ